MLNAKKVSKFFILGVCTSLVGSILGCGPQHVAGKTIGFQKVKTVAGLAASNELVGTWRSKNCLVQDRSGYSQTILKIDTTGKITVLVDSFGPSDSTCISSGGQNVSAEGTVAYGSAVSQPAGAKSIDISFSGEATTQQIYQMNGEGFCLGASITATVRPTSIDTSNCFVREQ